MELRNREKKQQQNHNLLHVSKVFCKITVFVSCGFEVVVGVGSSTKQLRIKYNETQN